MASKYMSDEEKLKIISQLTHLARLIRAGEVLEVKVSESVPPYGRASLVMEFEPVRDVSLIEHGEEGP